MTKFSLLSTAAAALLALSLPAMAAPFGITQQSSNVHGSNGHVAIKIFGPDTSVTASTGAFAVNADELGGNFTAWCLDIAHTLGLPSEYEITTTPFNGNTLSAAVQGTLKSLFDTAYATLDLTVANQSAGFQLALWEILTETDAAYNVNAKASDAIRGNFYATNNGNTGGAVGAANGFLGNLGGAKTGDYTLTFLQSTDGKQSLITVDYQPDPPAAVPLPAAGLLLFGALGGLGVVARRRQSAQA